MIVDTSALVAILQEEPERPSFLAVIAAAKRKLISAGNWVELGAVLSRTADDEMRRRLYALIDLTRIEIAPVTAAQAQLGHDAYLKFGKGRHAARLNFGDCFAYALVKETGLPLLFKGDDFVHTDIVSAV